MKILEALRNIVTTRWFISLLGVVIAGLVIWWFGDGLAFGAWRPFETNVAKLIAIVVMVFVWGASNLYTQYRSRQANQDLIAAMTEADARGDLATDRIDGLDTRFRHALGILQKRGFKKTGQAGRQYLYELPWYIIIGPPASGKTTAILNSGLRFALSSDDASHKYRGEGGTRNCDWFFTDDAVLIDTAGRYSTQDSDLEIDSAEWQGFLGLLRKHRPRQPINGVMVAISVEDLVQASGDQRLDHANAVRSRLLELADHLSVELPVYFLVTKLDLVAGFVEFFKKMDEAEGQQVWGVTFPYKADDQASGDQSFEFGTMFDRLVARLQATVNDQLFETKNIEERAAIYKFPAQIASLKSDLQRFLTTAFVSSEYETPIQCTRRLLHQCLAERSAL